MIWLFIIFSIDCESPGVGLLSNDVFAKVLCGSKSVMEFSQGAIYNERLETFLYVIDALERYNKEYIGFGFNSSKYLMPLLYGNVENSLFVSFIFYFGWLGAMLFILISFTALLLVGRYYDKKWIFLYVSLFVSVMLNSAGGFYSYGIFFFVLYLSYRAGIKICRGKTIAAR
jgi:hypothetical protein